MPKARNYRREYDLSQSSTKSKLDRARRNANRNTFLKAKRVKKGDGMDIDHRDGNPRNNSSKNLRVMTKSRNRSKK